MLLEQRRLSRFFLIALAIVAVRLFFLNSFVDFRPFDHLGFPRFQHDLRTFNATTKAVDANLVDSANTTAKNILEMNSANIIGCSDPVGNRYDHLKLNKDSIHVTRKTYYFAIILHDSMGVIEPLLAAVVRSMRFLGPQNCVLSIVEGRSFDGTYEVLQSIREELEALGALYFLSTDEQNPLEEGKDRVGALSELRNQALHPLSVFPEHFNSKTSIIFLNDVVPCMEDILELLHQQVSEKADMMCAMDWQEGPEAYYFYDTWIARSMSGNTFFPFIKGDSYHEHYKEMFWDHYPSFFRFQNHKPFQVFSCWNGIAVLSAKPFLEAGLRFRTAATDDGELYQGEPQLLSKDLWSLGYGKIAVASSVNVAYNIEGAKIVKAGKGFVSDWVNQTIEENATAETHIDWDPKPPEFVKVGLGSEVLEWNPWDQYIHPVAKGSQSQMTLLVHQ